MPGSLLPDVSHVSLKKRHVKWGFFSLAMFVVAYFQLFGESQDWQNYNLFFDNLRMDADFLRVTRFEPGFVLLSVLLSRFIGSNLVIYAIFVAMAVYLKAICMEYFCQNKKIFIPVMLFYLVRFAPLHELTQIRAACASSLALLAFLLIWKGRWIKGILASLSAMAFHSSAIFSIPLLLLQVRRRRTLVIVTLAVALLAMFGTTMLLSHFQNVFLAISMYLETGFGDHVPNAFSLFVLLDLGLAAISLFYWNSLTPMMKHALQVSLIGIAIFYGTLNFPVIANRTREFLSVFWIPFIAEGLQQKKSIRWCCGLFVFLSFLLYGYTFFLSGGSFI